MLKHNAKRCRKKMVEANFGLDEGSVGSLAFSINMSEDSGKASSVSSLATTVSSHQGFKRQPVAKATLRKVNKFRRRLSFRSNSQDYSEVAL